MNYYYIIILEVTYTADGQPHSKVAQDDDTQGDETASNHENNHVGLYSRVITSTEYIRSTGCFQSMRPVPNTGKLLVSSLCFNTHCLCMYQGHCKEAAG